MKRSAQNYFVLSAIHLLSIFLSNPSFGQATSDYLSPGRPAAILAEKIDQASPDQKSTLKAAFEKIYPTIVFIPGILGSSITTTKQPEKVLWGSERAANFLLSNQPDEDLAYTGSVNSAVNTTLLEEFYIEGKPVKPIYKEARKIVWAYSLAERGQLISVSYDWRQSNRDSARELSKSLCTSTEALGRPLVFVAHSMGGLILKYWLKHEYDSFKCQSGTLLKNVIGRIEQIIYVGTPHFGAPQAVYALADRYQVLFNGTNVNSPGFVEKYIDSVITKSLNAYGGTFPSIYELLPITNTKDCMPDGDRIPVEFRIKDTREPIKDIFSYRVWKELRWPKGLYPNDPNKRTKFVSEKLGELLNRAKEFQCDLAKEAKERALERFKTIRLYSKSEKTICAVIVDLPETIGTSPEVELESCDGDGTVPAWSAKEGNWGESREIKGEHLALLESQGFVDYLKSLFDEMEVRANNEYAEKSGTGVGPVDLYADAKHAIVPILNPQTKEEIKSNQVAIATNRLVEEKVDGQRPASTAPIAISTYNAAKKRMINLTDKGRADVYRVAADLSGTNARTRMWALHRAAYISLERENYTDAYILAIRALDAEKEAKDAPPVEKRKLRAEAAWFAAKSAKHLDKLADARSYQDIAIANGSKWARRVRY